MKWKSVLSESIRTGLTELMILYMLSKRDMYCYEIGKQMEKCTNGVFVFTESAVYAPIRRMSLRGLVTAHKEPGVGKRIRMYYHLEKSGEEYLAYGISECRTIFAEFFNMIDGKLDEN